MSTQQFGAKKSRSWADANPNYYDASWDSFIKPLKLKYVDNDYIQIRLIGDYFSAARVWVKFLKQDKNNPSLKIPGSYAEWCVDYNLDTEKFISADMGKCPYLKFCGYKPQVVWMGACIDRQAQADRPANATSDWTPIRYYEFTPKVAKQISDIVMLNKHIINGQRVAFGPEHPQYGLDISIIYKPKEKGPDRYGVQKMELTPLTKEESENLTIPIEIENNKGEKHWYYGTGHYKFVDIAKAFKIKPIETIMRDFNTRASNGTLLLPSGEIYVPTNGKFAQSNLANTLVDDDYVDDDVPVTPPRGPQIVQETITVQTPVAQTPVAQEPVQEPIAQQTVAQTPVAQIVETPVQPQVQQTVTSNDVSVDLSDPRINPALLKFISEHNANPNKLEILTIIERENEFVPNCLGYHAGIVKCFKCPAMIRMKCRQITDATI